MFNTILSKIGVGIATVLIGIAGAINPNVVVSPQQYQDLQSDIAKVQETLKTVQKPLGATNTKFVAGQTYRLAGSGVSASETSIILQSFKTQDGRELSITDFGDIGFGTIEPGTSNKEFISFTGVTQDGGSDKATLTGVSRGLDFISPYTASSSLRKAHSGNAKFIISNSPQLYDQLPAKDNDEIITGVWSFPTPTTASSAATKAYADGLVIAGGVSATDILPGISLIGTSGFGTATGTYSGTDYYKVPHMGLFNTTSSALNLVPVTKSNGKLSQGFLDLTEAITYSGGLTSSATTTLSGVNVLSGTTTVSGAITFSGSVSGIATSSGGSFIFATTTDKTISDTQTPSVLVTSTLPANTLGTNGMIHITLNFEFTNMVNGSAGAIAVGFGTATSSVDITNFSGAGLSPVAKADFYIYGNSSTTSQTFVSSGAISYTGHIGTRVRGEEKINSFNSAIDNTIYIYGYRLDSSSINTGLLKNVIIEKLY